MVMTPLLELVENIIGKDTPLIKGIGNHESLASSSSKRKSEKDHENDYKNLPFRNDLQQNEKLEKLDEEIHRLKYKIRKLSIKAQSLKNDLFD